MANVQKIFFKVGGMVKRGGITWIGWPTAIVSALEGTEGIQKITYMLEEEVFELWFIPNIISLERIFEKIKASGEERDLKYESFAVTNEVKK